MGWWEPVVRSAYNAAEEHGYHLLVHLVGERRDGVAGTISALGNVPTDGVIVFGFGASREVRRAAGALRLPVVYIDDTSTDPILQPYQQTIEQVVGWQPNTCSPKVDKGSHT